MTKGIIVMDMPNCCGECFALDDNGDYPVCLITQEQKGYTFNIRYCKMDRCPIQPMPEKYHIDSLMSDIDMDIALGRNGCINEILGGLK
jgi:hypothetical protein